MNYKVAETFDSLQGEGHYSGARMFFIRLAGCNVGKYETPPDEKLNELRVLNPTHSLCRSAIEGSPHFLCDTDYHSLETHTEESLEKLLVEASPKASPIVCITGGEPFLWDLQPLMEMIWKSGRKVHIETSGTRPILVEDADWITCSPKEGFIPSNESKIDEWKFVVGRNMGNPVEVAAKIMEFTRYARSKKIFIQPENTITDIDKYNVDYAYEVMKQTAAPWRMSLQIHKLLGMR